MSTRTPDPGRLGPTNPYTPFAEENLNRSVPLLFEQSVAKFPDRIAIQETNRSLSYQTLNNEANRVAHAILSKLGSSEQSVALILDHGSCSIIGILGALKAGKIHVPIAPGSPPDRVTHIIEDSGTQLILSNNQNRAFAERIKTEHQVILNIDSLDPGLSSQSPELDISHDRLAGLYYTSGSSGLPKAVAYTHQSLLNYPRGNINQFHIVPEDRVALVLPHVFAWSTSDLFGGLLSGSTILPYDLAKFGMDDLATWMIDQEITLFQAATTVFRSLVETLSSKEQFSHLRVISVGGEPLRKRDLESYKQHFPDTCLFRNLLGATETGGSFISLFMNKDSVPESDTMSVGFPGNNTEILLLDEQGLPVREGDVGEIHIRSPYLPQGYWRREELNEECYSRDPDNDKLRIWKSGDLGRFGPNGDLFPLGRKDSQVKIHGQRIELGEVENALLRHPGISSVVVEVRPDHRGENRLVAYLVCGQEPIPAVTEIRQAASRFLPEISIPSAFVFLETMPRTQHGKIDRKALPEPDSSRPQLDVQYAAPRTDIERRLLSIWVEVLDTDPIGIDDSFFDLGGHSILATQIINRIQPEFGVKIEFRTLFDAPTIAGLAAVITAHIAQIRDR